MSDNRPNVYIDDATGLVVYRASSLGRCVKELVAARLGLDGESPPDWMQERFDEGTNAEQAIIDLCYGDVDGRSAGSGDGLPGGYFHTLSPAYPNSYRVHMGNANERFPHVRRELLDDGQFTMELPVGNGRVVRGHLDGIGEQYGQPHPGDWLDGKTGQRVVIEIKHLATQAFERFLKHDPVETLRQHHPYYAWQVSLYMHATGLPCMFTVGEKLVEGTGEERVYKGVGRVTSFVIDEPMVSMGQVRAKIAKVEMLADKGELPVCDVAQYPCAFYYLHTEEDERVTKRGKDTDDGPRIIEVSDEVVVQSLVNAVSAYQSAGKAERAAKEAKAEAAAEIARIARKEIGDEGLTPGPDENKVGQAVVLRTSVGDVEWVKIDHEAQMIERKGYVVEYPKVVKSKWKGKVEDNG